MYHTPYDDKLLFGLSSTSRDILFYILLNIQPNEDYIDLSLKKLTKKVKLSRSLYYTSIPELKDSGLIAVKGKGVYWINGQIIFNGDRKKFFEKYYPDNLTVVHTISR